MRQYRRYTNEDIIRYCAESKSTRELLGKLGLKPTGGNYKSIHLKIAKLNIDISHWTRKLWNKNRKLKDYQEYVNYKTCKPHLIKDRGHQCEECKNTVWNNKEIPIEIHHLDGNSLNNKEDNLQLLCPNCHALTDNWRKHKDNYKLNKTLPKCLLCDNLVKEFRRKFCSLECARNYTKLRTNKQ